METKQNNKPGGLKHCALLLLLCAASAHAQLYKTVGPDGKITYSDMPPENKPGVKIERKLFTSAGGDDANLPFEVADAVKNNPVTLYTTQKCAPCDQGRGLLKRRGVPFREKTVNTNEDQAKLREVGGEGQLPILLVGRAKQVGFEGGAWNASLSAAGYPDSSVLPKTYQNPAAEPAAPPPETTPATANKGQNEEDAQKIKPGKPEAVKTNPGFRF